MFSFRWSKNGTGSGHASISEEIAALLENVYENDIESLSKLLGHSELFIKEFTRLL